MMGWRENMGVKNLKPQEQKPQKEQKLLEQLPFATIAPFALGNQKIKNTPAAAPYSSKVQKEHVREYTAKKPERLKKIPGLADDLIQAPVVWIREEEKTWTPDTCPCRCKRTGKCYGESYFLHKAGKSQNCQGDQCPWMK